MTPTVDAEALLALALSEPRRALAEARAILASTPGPVDASVAHQSIGLVLRDEGRVSEALVELRAALRAAELTGLERRAEVLPSLGVALAYAGRMKDARRHLDEAESITPPHDRPRLLLRRAHALMVSGAYDQALTDVTASIRGSHRHHDVLWEARGLNNRSHVHLALGNAVEAERDAERARLMFEAVGQRMEATQARHNCAHAAELRGDLPVALALMDEVVDGYRTLGARPADVDIDRARMYLNAGLAGEAREVCELGLTAIPLRPVKRAELHFTAAQAALADGDAGAASGNAARAGKLFAAQRRPTWAHRASLLALQARYVADGASPRLLRECDRLVTALDDDRAVELPVAQLLHGRLAHAVGQDQLARASLELAAQSRHRGSALSRAAGWLAAALLADIRQDRRALLHACRRGLDAVDEHRALLGDIELRALASRHGNELAEVAFRSALQRGDSRAMLWWIERWRATALAAPRIAPPQDADLQRAVAALRDLARRVDAADGAAPEGLRQERSRLEGHVRRAYRQRRAADSRQPRFAMSELVNIAGDTTLLSLVNLDGRLYAFTIADGRVRRRDLGPVEEALREARFTRFALRRAAFGRAPDVAAAGGRLQRAILSEQTDEAWGRPRVVVVPTAPLLTAPWGLLPVFADTALTVSPSATLWARARQSARASRTGREGRIALVTGPGLSTGEAEATALSPLHATARAVSGKRATVAGALEVLDGARLAHVAAHGTFRADAPMFSSLMLHDGPLTVHDLDRLQRPPAGMVLSACDSGNSAPIGANEALGLVSSLLAMGTATVVASVVPVNDRATVGVMHTLHRTVQGGGSLAEGLLAARQAATNPLERATAGAFTVWGA